MIKIEYIIFMSFVLILATLSCSSSGEGKKDNPFNNNGKAPVLANYNSNADTVFLSWKLQEDSDFDSYIVTDQYGKNEIELDKKATSCFLTQIPYNQNCKISIGLVSNGEIVKRTDVLANINGFDKSISSEIMPDNGSVTEGDGMYSIYLGNGKSLFLMGDSYTGRVLNGKRVSGNHMYRNSYSVFDHKTRSSYPICEEKGPNTSAAVPNGVTDESQRWYWPGHGFVVGNKLYVFQLLMYKGAGADGWNFHYEKTHILQYGLPDINVMPEHISEIPFSATVPQTPSAETPEIHFGAAALNDLDNTGYIYIYAQVNIENDMDPVTEAYVARTTLNDLYTKWEYYNGSTWVIDGTSAKGMAGLSSVPISSQFNVFKLNDKYVLIAQNKTFNNGEIYTFTSDKPWGPWGHKKLVYKVPDLGNNNWYSYNAMAHPQLEKSGMILMTFNVNTSDFSEQSSNVDSYRPRFVWINKNTILN
jgi:hypothetical protein